MTTLTKEATAEMLAAARHYGGMRFSMMAAFFILMGLLVNAYLNWKPLEDRFAAAWIGMMAAVWFAWFEFLLSYNLAKLWNDVLENTETTYAGVAPQRNRFLVWSARITLPLPYLVSGAAWGTLIAAGTWVPAYVPGVVAALWLALCIGGWAAAEYRKW